jgi:hypothetical protein
VDANEPDEVRQLLQTLAVSLDDFIEAWAGCRPEETITAAWDAKDVLCHIASWHQYYARNLAAEAAGSSFVMPKVKYSVLNQMGVEAMRPQSPEALITALRQAQATIDACVRSGKVQEVTYRSGSRPYSIAKFLQVVSSHIQGHARALRRAARRR